MDLVSSGYCYRLRAVIPTRRHCDGLTLQTVFSSPDRKTEPPYPPIDDIFTWRTETGRGEREGARLTIEVTAAQERRAPRWLGPTALIALALAAAALIGERVWLAASEPLWLDETWTAAIVSAPGAHGFWREVYLDVNAPLYYVFMRGWSHLFGLSDLALRIPGLVLAPLTAVLVLFARPDAEPLEVRRGWAALLFFWWGCGQFLDARCYAMLLALCTLQALVFARLLRRPSTGRAAIWCVISALAILCQYYALFIGLAQGLVYVWTHRARAARTWPALIALAPAGAWIVHHAPRLAQYGRPDVAWHQTVDASSSVALASFTVGAYSPWLTLMVAASLALAMLCPLIPAKAGNQTLLHRRAPEPEPTTDLAPLWRTVAAGVLALVLVLLSGVLKPTLTARYLIPVTPSILLGVVLWARATRHGSAALAGLVVAYAAFALNPTAFAAKARLGAPYGSEAASAFLLSHSVTDVVFLWDHPATKIMDPVSLQRVGGVFFRRAGAQVAVTPMVAAQDEDASLALLNAAHGAHPGLIWIYDRTGRTASRTHPPHIAQLDPYWICQTYGDGEIGSIACYRAGSPGIAAGTS